MILVKFPLIEEMSSLFFTWFTTQTRTAAVFQYSETLSGNAVLYRLSTCDIVVPRQARMEVFRRDEYRSAGTDCDSGGIIGPESLEPKFLVAITFFGR